MSSIRRTQRAFLACGCLLGLLAFAPAASADGVPLQKGDILASVGTGLVEHFNPSGQLVDTLSTTVPGTYVAGMCFDGAQNLFVTNFDANALTKFDKGGNLITAQFGSGYNAHPESCVVDGQGNIYVGQADGSANILKFDSTGQLLASFAPTGGPRGTDWIDLAADGCTMQYTSEGGSIRQFDVCTNTQLPDFTNSLTGPCYAHRLLPDGTVLVACSTQVYHLDASGAVIKTYPEPSGGSGVLFALNIDPDGTSFWTGDLSTGDVWKFDIASGNVLQHISVSVKSALGGLTIVGELTAASDPSISAAPGPAINATEAQSFTGTVATVTDPDSKATAGEYTATVDWGDGTTSTGTVSGSGGSFTVNGAHTYARMGTYTVTTTITDSDRSTNSASATTTATVADAAITATGAASSHATEGASLTSAVASFSDPNTAAAAGDYSAKISWGDGSTSSGTITGSGGHYTVTGTHTYAEEGSDKIAVTVTDTDTATNTASASSSATVGDAPLKAKGVKKTTGHVFNGTIATFTDPDPAGTSSDYSITIDWGDGSKSHPSASAAADSAAAAIVAAVSGTSFRVKARHRFARSGVHHVTVTIMDAGGSKATAISLITVRSGGSATLVRAPLACVLKPFTLRVRGTQIARVSYVLDGSALSVSTVHRGTMYSAVIAVTPGGHRLTVTVRFTRASRTRPRTFHPSITGCAAPPPKFTG